MPKFITHEAISNGSMNLGYTGGFGPLLPWQEALRNSIETLDLMMLRMKMDYEGIQAKQRKPWGHKDVEAWT